MYGHSVCYRRNKIERLPHVWGEVNVAGVPRHHVTFEDLLTHVLEAIQHIEDDDLIVHGLAGQPLA